MSGHQNHLALVGLAFIIGIISLSEGVRISTTPSVLSNILLTQSDGDSNWITIKDIVDNNEGKFNLVDSGRLRFRWGSEDDCVTTTSGDIGWDGQKLVLSIHFEKGSDSPFALSVYTVPNTMEVNGVSITLMSKNNPPLQLSVISLGLDTTDGVQAAAQSVKAPVRAEEQQADTRSFWAKYWWVILGATTVLSLQLQMQPPPPQATTQERQ